MAHWAKVNNGIVERVIVADAKPEYSGEWIQTSYNTLGGVHYVPNVYPRTPSEDQSKALRKNFAGIGFTYDSQRDAFIPPKPYSSWVLVEETCQWTAPVSEPTNGFYKWNEDTISWVEIV